MFEIIEIYEDQAIQAVRALRRLARDASIAGKLDLSSADTLKSERGGRRRITFDDPPGWWDRIQILAGDPVSDFVELPGAQAEACEVCNELERSSFEVHKCLRSNAGEVVQQLYGRVYKVLHLAGSCDSQREALARRYQEPPVSG